jgi:cobalt-zinc-cadmium efflux system protein
LGIGLNLAFVAFEWVAGAMAHSMALMADASHNLSDVLGLALAWTAFALSRRKPSHGFTYGLGRSSILAALFNAMLLMAAIGGIAWEAMQRIFHPQAVRVGMVMAVAGVGILINTATALFFLRGRKSDLNIRGAFLHMAIDALVSLGVVLGGYLVLRTGWLWVDPLLSLIIVGVILIGTWDLLRESLHLSLDGVPRGLKVEDVRATLLGFDGVTGLHNLHVWATSTTESALSVHLHTDLHARDGIQAEIVKVLHDRFGIEHATLQMEHDDFAQDCQVRHDF